MTNGVDAEAFLNVWRTTQPSFSGKFANRRNSLKKMFTQPDRLMNYFMDNKSINPLTAWQELGIYRLSSTVHILRGEGYDIETKLIPVENQFGETCKVAQYTLKEEA